jgi:putative endopeptidase
LNNWWTEEDSKKFDEHAAKLSAFFDKIEVAPGVHANGKFTLGENIADQGGLLVSFNAFKKVLSENPLPEKDGYTPEQRFFLSYAGVWANNIRPEEVLKRTKTDPHSLGKWRVDATLTNIEGWYDAFNVKSGDKMYVAPEDRAVIW